MTGQPDFADITIRYIPDSKIVESKSLKLYFWSFRDQGIFHEHVSNQILDDLVRTLQPRWCEVETNFAVRGGAEFECVQSMALFLKIQVAKPKYKPLPKEIFKLGYASH